MAGPQVGGGVVDIELDGKPMQLVPSLEACLEISKIGGGINGAVQRLNQLHFETICEIIGAGLQIEGKRLNPKQRKDQVPQAVYNTGLVSVAADCITFCHMIANGGRPLEDSEDDDDKEGDDAPLGSATSSSIPDSSN